MASRHCATLHWPLPDPAGAAGSDEEVLEAFRRTRDRIRELLIERFGGEMPRR